MTPQKWDAIWINAEIATCENGYGLIQQGAMAVLNDKIVWLGECKNLPASPESLAVNVYDVAGKTMTPGFIDCHTHLVYAGNRAHEFEERLNGASYEDIAKRGGGIQFTVSKTRAASQDELLQQSLPRARALMASGVTTLEIKSGYGLDLATEIKILQVAKKISEKLPMTICSTFLGAHTFPTEYRDHPNDYVDEICQQMIPMVAKEKLAEAVDVFCESIAFNLAQTERVFVAATEHGLRVKCHAEQLSDSGAAALAAKYHALSVDHLEYLSHDGIAAIKAAGTVAVLLPGAFYFLRETKMPPLAALRENNIPIAIASDCNPGTSPIMSMLIILNMAATLYRLTPEEALLGVTKNAAQALGLLASHGTLAVGKIADFAVWDVTHPRELTYQMGHQPLQQLVKSGKIISL